jgi:hypothetical protein
VEDFPISSGDSGSGSTDSISVPAISDPGVNGVAGVSLFSFFTYCFFINLKIAPPQLNSLAFKTGNTITKTNKPKRQFKHNSHSAPQSD